MRALRRRQYFQKSTFISYSQLLPQIFQTNMFFFRGDEKVHIHSCEGTFNQSWLWTPLEIELKGHLLIYGAQPPYWEVPPAPHHLIPCTRSNVFNRAFSFRSDFVKFNLMPRMKLWKLPHISLSQSNIIKKKMVKALTIKMLRRDCGIFFSHHTSLKLANASMIWPPAPTMCALSVTAKSVSWRFTTASFLSSRLLCSALMDWKNAFSSLNNDFLQLFNRFKVDFLCSKWSKP